MMNIPAEIRYPLVPFSAIHILFLAVLIPAAMVTAFVVSKKYGFSKKVIWTSAIIGMLCEIERLIFFIKETPGGYRLAPSHIPLNHCPFMVVLILYLALTEAPQKHRKLLAFMYPMMVGGGFIGMLLPSAAVNYHGLAELATYRYFFYHSMVIFTGLYLFLSKPFEYEMKDYGMGLFLCFCSLFIGVWVNGFFGWDEEVNYMFVVRPPLKGLPILNFRHGWPGYMLDMSGIGFVLITSCYIPVIIKSIKRVFIKK